MKTLVNGLQAVRVWVQKLGPYVLLEVLLPGGTILALLLFLYRRRRLALAPSLS